MNNSFSLEQISKPGKLFSNSTACQYELFLMARFMEIKSVNPKMKQDQLAKEKNCSRSTLQRHRQDINMLLPYKIPSNTHKRRQKDFKYKHRW